MPSWRLPERSLRRRNGDLLLAIFAPFYLFSMTSPGSFSSIFIFRFFAGLFLTSRDSSLDYGSARTRRNLGVTGFGMSELGRRERVVAGISHCEAPKTLRKTVPLIQTLTRTLGSFPLGVKAK
jgi:hypothetical protein